MRRFLTTSLLSIATSCVFAQHAMVKEYTAPFAGSVNLREVDDKYGAQLHNLEAPNPDANIERKRLNEIKKQVAILYPYKKHASSYKTTSIVPLPVLENGFVADSLSGMPPDNDMAISKANKAVSVVNSTVAILDGQAGKMAYRKGLKVFSSVVGLNDLNSDYRYDPKVIYDPEADRFICVMLNSTNQFNWIVVGFSKTNDPAGSWSFYKFYGDYKSDTTWFDYPCIAITKDDFFLTGNKIGYNTSWQSGFSETVIYQIKKKEGYDSATNLSYKIWDGINFNGKPIRNLYPVKGGRGIIAGDQYFLSNRNFDTQNDTVFLVKLPASGDNASLEIKALKTPLAYGVPPDGRQPDTAYTLATNDGRILGAFAEGSEIQFVSTSVHPISGSSAIYHGKIAGYNTAPVIEAEFVTVDTLDFGYPNITYAGTLNDTVQSLISFNYTGPKKNPGMGAVLYDGMQYSPMLIVKAGDSSIRRIAGKQQRWGDYMGAQVDWNNIGTVWLEGIYGRRDRNYGNWMAKVTSPLQRKDRTVFETPTLYPNPAWQFVNIEFESANTDVLDFAIYNLQGQLVDQVLKAKSKKGQNVLRFDIASLPTGIYFLKVVDSKNDVVALRKFTKQ